MAKIQGKDFTAIKTACLTTLAAYNFPISKIKTKRHRWDVLNKASDTGRINIMKLHKSYSGKHIDTALRSIFGHTT
jgi:hypothetical protein